MSTTGLPVMIFAAGFGTRMRELTRDRPKPLIDVGGEPMIDRALGLARAVKPDRIAANLHYKADMLAAHLAPQGVALSREEPDILDTGGGLRTALPLLGHGPVITLNPDAIWHGPNPLAALLRAWDPARMDALLMCVSIGQTLGRTAPGDFSADAQGRIARGGNLVYGGAQIIKPDGLADIADKVFSLNLLWDRMIKGGRAFALPYPGRWCDVGNPEGVQLAETMLAGADV